MKKCIIRKLTAVSVLLLCVFLAGCGCGKKKTDPAASQVLKISITPEPSPTPEPEQINADAIVTRDGITMVNQYLLDQGSREPDKSQNLPEEPSESEASGENGNEE